MNAPLAGMLKDLTVTTLHHCVCFCLNISFLPFAACVVEGENEHVLYCKVVVELVESNSRLQISVSSVFESQFRVRLSSEMLVT